MYIKPEYDALIEPEKVLITPGQLFRTVWAYLSSMEELASSISCIDYALADSSSPALFSPEYDLVRAIVETGGSEGIYIDCYLEISGYGRREGKSRIHLGTIKTLDEGLDAYMKMGKIAGAFTCIGEMYLWKNYKKLRRQYSVRKDRNDTILGQGLH